MKIYKESGFWFDFTAAGHSTIHDKLGPDEDNPDAAIARDGNTFWRGVDFRVMEDSREVWVEIKSWSTRKINQQMAWRSVNKDYKTRTKANELRDEIIDKFLGATSYLTWSGTGVPNRVFYVVFLQPPNRRSTPLLGPFRDRLRDEFKNAQNRSWGSRIAYQVVDLAMFQTIFPDYPVRRV
jgi:hypothetical protein